MPAVKTKSERVAPKLEWTVGVVSVQLFDNDKELPLVEVEAALYGSLAVHKPLADDVAKVNGRWVKEWRWCVTHAPTGLSLAKVSSEIDAIMIAEYVANAVDLSVITQAKDEKLPPWLLPYCAECSRQCHYVPPETVKGAPVK